MSVIAELDTYRARLAGLPSDAFIGSILWYSITGTLDRTTGERIQIPVRVTREQLKGWFTDLGLDHQFLPPPILKVDAFRKATSTLASEYDLPDGKVAKLYIDEIESNPEFVERHLLRKVIDPRQEQDEAKLRHEWMATLRFFRGGRTNQAKRSSGDHYKARMKVGLPAADGERVASMLLQVDERYTDLCANLNEDKIRWVLRGYLRHLNAIAVRPSGAMYFVHSGRQSELDALQTLVHRIGQGCTFDQIPMINADNSRQILTNAFQDEVEDDVRLLLTKIAALNDKARAGLAGGDRDALLVPAKVYADLNAEYQAVVKRAEEYTNVLGLAQGKAAAALELALDQVVDLSQRIRREPRHG